MKKIYKISLSILIFFFCTGFDRITKNFAQEKLSVSPPTSMWGDTIRIQFAENPGGMLGLGSHLPDPLRIFIFIILVGVILTTVILYAIQSRDLKLAQFAGLLILASGGTGNLVDRIVNHGAGIDFMNLGIGALRTGIFNFADIFIMGGMFIFLIASMKKEKNRL